MNDVHGYLMEMIMTKGQMIQEIFICMKANQLYISGDLFLTLAFRTEDELKNICRELGIKI